MKKYECKYVGVKPDDALVTPIHRLLEVCDEEIFRNNETVAGLAMKVPEDPKIVGLPWTITCQQDQQRLADAFRTFAASGECEWVGYMFEGWSAPASAAVPAVDHPDRKEVLFILVGDTQRVLRCYSYIDRRAKRLADITIEFHELIEPEWAGRLEAVMALMAERRGDA